MAERLYRGKVKREYDQKYYGKWVYGYYCPYGFGDYFPLHPAIYPKSEMEAGHSVPVEIIPDTLGQYIGRRDMYKTMIFENDIVQYYGEDWDEEDGPGVVKWDEESARFVIELDGMIVGFDDCNSWEVKVIGNTIDNPELLKREK